MSWTHTLKHTQIQWATAGGLRLSVEFKSDGWLFGLGYIRDTPHLPLLVSASSKNNSFQSSMSSDLNYLTAPCSFSILAARSSSLASHGNSVNEALLELCFCCYGNSHSLPGGYSHKLAVNTQRWHVGIFGRLFYGPVTALMYKVKAHRHFL